MSSQTGLFIVLPVGALFVAWYIAGNELMRRRSRRLAAWCRAACSPMGGPLTIQWLTVNSFRIEARDGIDPFRTAILTGLVESWDVPVIWFWNRRRGRRDMVLLQCELRASTLLDLELYRNRSLLAGDARHIARQQGWPEEPLDEFYLAPGGNNTQGAAHQLLAEIGTERANLVRVAVRRRDAKLTLALNVPQPAQLEPERFFRMVCAVAKQITRSNTATG